MPELTPGKTVKIVIDKKGNGTVEMFGFHGAGCGVIADKLKAIGRTSSETNKPEFHESTLSGQMLDMSRG